MGRKEGSVPPHCYFMRIVTVNRFPLLGIDWRAQRSRECSVCLSILCGRGDTRRSIDDRDINYFLSSSPSLFFYSLEEIYWTVDLIFLRRDAWGVSAG